MSTPIDLGPETDTVYLALYGANIRTRNAVEVRIGGEPVQVLYAGATPGYNNLDQVNVRLPRSLAGRGEVDVILTADGKATNAVKINIK